MVVRMGALRTLALGAVSAMVAGGLGLVTTPAADAGNPVLPGPASPSWLVVKKAGTAQTDGTNDMATAHLNLSPSGGTLAGATVFVGADLEYAYFRFHVAALPPADAAGGYVVQFDTDGNTNGWERALRFNPVARTVGLYTGGANTATQAAGTLATTVPLPPAGAASYAGADGGAFVAFAVPRAKLTENGITLGAPMVFGTSTQDGVALYGGGLLGTGSKADIIAVGKTNPGWNSVASDALDIDSDGDGVIDRLDNCPVVANPGQEDDDKTLDNSLPPGSPGQPDGTEGQGNVCDATPRGYDADDDNVGLLDDQCPERPGLLSNGCVARSTTTAILRYAPRRKTFTGIVRADFDQCVPRRGVAVFKVTAGPDRQLGSGKTDAAGKYALVLKKRAASGRYYLKVDPKNIFDVGVTCFGVKSPAIKVG